MAEIALQKTQKLALIPLIGRERLGGCIALVREVIEPSSRGAAEVIRQRQLSISIEKVVDGVSCHALRVLLRALWTVNDLRCCRRLSATLYVL